MVSKPSLRQQPLGITQKYLVVTCNYPARAFGVGKLMAIAVNLSQFIITAAPAHN
eukprot:COSAG01_NODE_2060_length_8520_cov_4.178839_10_plen_55_part_00